VASSEWPKIKSDLIKSDVVTITSACGFEAYDEKDKTISDLQRHSMPMM